MRSRSAARCSRRCDGSSRPSRCRNDSFGKRQTSKRQTKARWEIRNCDLGFFWKLAFGVWPLPMRAMNVATANTSTSIGWDGPGAPDARRPFTWQGLLWRLVFPKRRHRIALTIPGLFLMALALGIGTAAYNTASNILFITLSLL